MLLLPGLGGLAPCSEMLLSGAAGHGWPQPGRAALEANAARGQDSVLGSPHGPLVLSWSSSSFRVKGSSSLTFSVNSLQGVGAIGRCPWSSLAVAIQACPSLNSPTLFLGLLWYLPPVPSPLQGCYSWGSSLGWHLTLSPLLWLGSIFNHLPP